MERATIRIIAEAGVNHNGCLQRALAMVDAAADAGADVVKFQTFRAHSLATANAPKAKYQQQSTDAGENQAAMLSRLELDAESHQHLLRRSAERGINFLSTPFDLDSARFLIEDLGLPEIKLSSGDLTNAPLLLAVSRADRPLLLSTGMAGLGEIEDALGVLAFGFLNTGIPPGLEAFRAAWRSPQGQAKVAEQVTLLHCTSEYPAPFSEVNLRAMVTLAQAFGVRVGYSDHTPGLAIPIAAAAMGASIIEKHFTLDRALPGPDHAASLEPDELAEMVRAIRSVEAALGSGIKSLTPSEAANRAVARKSIVAATPIRAGAPLTLEALSIKRPGGGVEPLLLWDLIGKPAPRDFAVDERISWSILE